MTDYCAFSKDHKCIKFTDYEITRHELEEADELCHAIFQFCLFIVENILQAMPFLHLMHLLLHSPLSLRK